jgi:hypothetical protein
MIITIGMKKCCTSAVVSYQNCPANLVMEFDRSIHSIVVCCSVPSTPRAVVSDCLKRELIGPRMLWCVRS